MTTPKEPEEPLEEWAVVEFMGHVRLAGLLTEHDGKKILELNIRIRPGDALWNYFGDSSASSIWRSIPCTEEVARQVAHGEERA